MTQQAFCTSQEYGLFVVTAYADSTRSRYTDFRLEVNRVVAEIRENRRNRVIVDLGYLNGCVLSFFLVRNCDSEQTATS